MKKINILYIGMHAEIRETVVRITNNNEAWKCTGTGDVAEARELFSQTDTDLVLLGAGLDENTETELRSYFATVNPQVKVVQHYGGGSGLLANEILHALEGA